MKAINRTICHCWKNPVTLFVLTIVEAHIADGGEIHANRCTITIFSLATHSNAGCSTIQIARIYAILLP